MIRLLLAALWKPVAALLALWAIRADAKRDQRRETALQAAEAIARRHKQRERIEDAIDQDTGLAARARRIGLVRPDGE